MRFVMLATQAWAFGVSMGMAADASFTLGGGWCAG
jgi:hypothetical protein